MQRMKTGARPNPLNSVVPARGLFGFRGEFVRATRVTWDHEHSFL